jgi:hypothetical protein
MVHFARERFFSFIDPSCSKIIIVPVLKTIGPVLTATLTCDGQTRAQPPITIQRSSKDLHADHDDKVLILVGKMSSDRPDTFQTVLQVNPATAVQRQQ